MKTIVLTIAAVITILISNASYAKNGGGSSSHGVKGGSGSHGLIEEGMIGPDIVKFDPEIDFSLFVKGGGFERITTFKGDKSGNSRRGNGTERGLVAKGDKTGNSRKGGGVERGII